MNSITVSSVTQTVLELESGIDLEGTTIDDHLGLDRWHRHLARRVLVTDVTAIAIAMCLVRSIRFHTDRPAMPYTVISVVFAAIWIIALAWTHSRESFVLGAGVEEFRRIRNATAVPFVVFAVAGLWLEVDFARGHLAIALASGCVLVLGGRLFWRRRLASWRRHGVAAARVVIFGADEASLRLATALRRDRSGAVSVVGICIPGYTGAQGATVRVPGGDLSVVETIPILGDESALVTGVAAMSADMVAVTASEALGTDRLRELGWVLNDLGIRLIVAPGILDVPQPRIRFAPIAEVSLIHIERPRYRGASRIGKVAFDRVGALLTLAVLAPVLLALTVAVTATTRGPALYVSERIGAGGLPFRMYKFRSMYVSADTHKAELLAENVGAGPLFKMQRDPRVTPVGRVIRRYSLDELPQLLNVALGHMSLVGPRPHLDCEVRTYSTSVERRMLVKPGMTGLWQVSGRSDLDWQESVRLDLKYVENWSFLLDIYILAQTVRAVISTRGAY